MALKPESFEDSVDGTGEKAYAHRQCIDDILDGAWPQDVVVSKIGTQYDLSKQNYRLIIYNFT